MMFGGYEQFVAKRYLVTRKKTGFISVISVISILGITVGVAALIIVLSLMNGFSKELRTRLLGMDGHVWVSNPLGAIDNYGQVTADLKAIPGVVGASPFCSFPSAAKNREGSSITSVEVRGVDIATVDGVSDIRQYIRSGEFDLGRDADNVPGVVLGSYLSYKLGYADIGDDIFVYGYDLSNLPDTFETTMPPVFRFRVTGIFESGYYDYDNAVMLIAIGESQRILTLPNQASGISIKLKQAFEADRYTGSDGIIANTIGGLPLTSVSWVERNRTLFKWMQLEKWAAFLVLSLIVLVAAFNIVSSLIMLVMDKTREIGILKSMGATSASIERIFVLQGTFIGITGTLSGGALGTLLTWLQDHYRFISLPPDIYFVSALPMDLQIRDVVSVTVVALVLCWVSSYYPARKAAALDPVEAIRSE